MTSPNNGTRATARSARCRSSSSDEATRTDQSLDSSKPRARIGIPKASSYGGKAINPQRTQWDALVKAAIDRATKLGQRDRATRWSAHAAKAEAAKLNTGR
jgi:hypothetical protein